MAIILYIIPHYSTSFILSICPLSFHSSIKFLRFDLMSKFYSEFSVPVMKQHIVHYLIPSDQRGPGRRGPVRISSGSLLCARQMHHKEMWCESCAAANPNKSSVPDNYQCRFHSLRFFHVDIFFLLHMCACYCLGAYEYIQHGCCWPI